MATTSGYCPVLSGRFAHSRLAFCTFLALAQSACVTTMPPPDTPDMAGKLRQRDAQIDNLLKRVQQLERQAQTPSPPAGSNSAPAADRLPAPPAPAQPPPQTTVASVQPAASPPSAQPTSRQAPRPGSKPAPGAFDVDEEAAQRALERTLVITGALLLPYGQFEAQPGFNYQRYSGQSSLIARTPYGLAGGNLNWHTDIIGGNVFMRLGLPWDTQLEANTPFQSIDRQTTATLYPGSILSSSENKATGFGDFRLGLAKTLLREKNWWPDIIARLTWDSDTGQIPNAIPIGTGYNELQGSLTLTKRQDPLVFIGTLSYQSAFAKNNLRPGDMLGFSLGTILAASPETSLRMILNQNFIDQIEYRGTGIHGSERNITTMNFGASTIIGKGMFLDFTAGLGLTREAPDYTVGTSFAMRFDLPYLPGIDTMK